MDREYNQEEIDVEKCKIESVFHELDTIIVTAAYIQETVPIGLVATIPGSRTFNETYRDTKWHVLANLGYGEESFAKCTDSEDPNGWSIPSYRCIRETSFRPKLEDLQQCIFVALYNGNVETAKRLLALNPKPEPSIWYVFFAMAGDKGDDMVEVLSTYLTPRYMISPLDGTVRSCHGWNLNLAQWAIVFGSYAWLCKILCPFSSQKLADSKLPNGMNLLHLAVIFGNQKIIDYLLSLSVPYDLDNFGYFPVCYNLAMIPKFVERFSHERVVQVMIGPHENFTLLHLAVAARDKEWVGILRKDLPYKKPVTPDSFSAESLENAAASFKSALDNKSPFGLRRFPTRLSQRKMAPIPQNVKNPALTRNQPENQREKAAEDVAPFQRPAPLPVEVEKVVKEEEKDKDAAVPLPVEAKKVVKEEEKDEDVAVPLQEPVIENLTEQMAALSCNEAAEKKREALPGVECPYCLEALQKLKTVITLPCCHVYCIECVGLVWKSKEKKCGLCNNVVEGFRQIYFA